MFLFMCISITKTSIKTFFQGISLETLDYLTKH